MLEIIVHAEFFMIFERNLLADFAVSPLRSLLANLPNCRMYG
ncbi:hypothetical protein [Microcoleus sp. bin38.metabat.b11b12b14.051]|nr:hypothetical protein [Microcoleus sp. bin38.metabat.b11b12b14.051]